MTSRRAGEPNAPSWLTARPIAHRGLHATARGLVENTLGAAAAAIAKGYAIECDVGRAACGEAVVFHDDALERLTLAEGRLDAFSAKDLAVVRFRDCGETIPTLGAFLAKVAGQTPLIIEIKSRFNGDMRLAARVLTVLAAYSGPAAVKSFDPEIIAWLRAESAPRPLGLVAEARYDGAEWPELLQEQRRGLEVLSGFAAARPDFLSWNVADLPHATPELCRAGLGLPVMSWTVRTPQDWARAERWADQMIFEGFEP